MKKTLKIALTRNLPIPAKTFLDPHYSAVTILEKGRPLKRKELEKVFAENEVVICSLTDRIDESLLEKAPKLKHLISFSTGTDHIDLNALKKRGLRLSHTPGVLTESTADLTWALLLGCARRIKAAETFCADGRFNGFGPELFLGLELTGATLGIVGMGQIGMAVAGRALSFGMRVKYHSRSEITVPHCKRVNFSELIEEADVLSLHCPLRPETQHMVSKLVLEKMKPNAILINTARGPLINETALLEHLRRNPEFYVGLDVYEREPTIDPELLSMPNALCLPHIGSATHRARGRMAETCISEAIRFAKKQRLQYEYPI